MLTSFTVSGFKSVRDEAQLELAPLTTLVGANSSGKSSLLQAFLLLSQSVQRPSSDSALDFNGLYLNLGTLQEVQTRPLAPNLVIGCGFTLPESRRRVASALDPAAAPRSATFRLSASTVDESPSKPARVDDLDLRVRDADGFDHLLLAHRRRGGFPPTPHMPNPSNRPTLLASQNYRVEADTRIAISSDSSGPISGVELAGPLPVAVWRSYDSVVRAVDITLRNLLLFSAHPQSTIREGTSDQVQTLVLDFWMEPGIGEILGDRPKSIDDAYRRLASVRPIIRTRARSLVGEYLQKVPSRRDPDWAFERLPLPSTVATAVDELRERLSNVLYLGPLRAAPRPLFAAAAGTSPKSVGREGEFTASLLSRYADERVTFHWLGERKSEPLGDAVGRWMRHLDLHAGATAHNYGRLGHDLVVEDSIVGGLDLTQVGVGVSQALPVIVQCLIAPAGSVVVLEQPELHLHPRVQSRLADFLVGASKAGRTILCETHSEYLVSKLRIATGHGELQYGRDYRLYFTSRIEGFTRIEEVKVHTKGRLVKWPAGFFDQSAEDANELLEVQLR